MVIGLTIAALLASLVAVALLVVAGARRRRELADLVVRMQSRDSQMLVILDGLPVVVMLRAADGTLLHLNPAGERFLERLGVDRSAIEASPSSLLDHVEVVTELGEPYRPDDLPVVSAWRDVAGRDATLGYALPEGGHAWYTVRAEPALLSDGTTGTVVTCDDVTERHRARQRVELAERVLRQTFDHAPIGIAVFTPDGALVEVNDALCSLLGRDERQLLAVGLQCCPRPGEPPDDWALLADRLRRGESRHVVERYVCRATGEWVFTELSVAVVRDDDGTAQHMVAQLVDLSARRDLEEQLRTAALNDPLTGLANRRALAEHLTEAQWLRHSGGHVGLLFFDLDRFKDVNDTWGHDIGDRVLVAMADRLRGVVRDGDTVARLGGDEFAVLCAPVDGWSGLQRLVERIRSMPPLRVPVDDGVVEIGSSVGAVMVEPGEDLDVALRGADAAMYRAKRARRRPRPASA